MELLFCSKLIIFLTFSCGWCHSQKECDNAGHQTLSGGATLCSGNGKKKDGGVYVGVEDEENEQPDADGVDDIWKEMSFVLEYSKVHL